MKADIIYQDPVHQEQVKKELETTRLKLQNLLDEWIGLDIGPLENWFQLIQNPTRHYSEAVRSVVEVPATSRYQINKDLYMQILDVPTPNTLYLKAKEAQKAPLTGILDLWRIEGNKFVVDADRADELIFARSVVATTPEQKKLAADVCKYVELSKSLTATLSNMPGAGYLTSLPWQITGRQFPGMFILEMEPEGLRDLLSKV
jgi:hypothetical protein